MHAGQRNLLNQIDGPYEEGPPPDRLFLQELLEVLLDLVLGLGVVALICLAGVVFPVYAWLRIRPVNPELAQLLLVLVFAGWAWTGLVLLWGRTRE